MPDSGYGQDCRANDGIVEINCQRIFSNHLRNRHPRWQLSWTASETLDGSNGSLRLIRKQVMKNGKKTALQPQVHAEPITEFEVTEGGTLRMAEYVEAKTRAEFYEDVADQWAGSPQDLADAMDECQPLAWAVNSIYANLRDEIEADIGIAKTDAKRNKRRVAVLNARLMKLPEDPEDGVSDWLLGFTMTEFEANVVPRIQEWFSELPDWAFEDEYLPQMGTAQGAALEFFRGLDAASMALLGVQIVEGEHPGSTYWAAELRGDIDASNCAAEALGLRVQFVKS